MTGIVHTTRIIISIAINQSVRNSLDQRMSLGERWSVKIQMVYELDVWVANSVHCCLSVAFQPNTI